MDVQYSQENLVSPDGTPPSQPSLSDDYRSNYGAVSAPRTTGRRPWLGSEILSEMDQGIPLPKKRSSQANGYTSQAAEQADLLSVMEASWWGAPSLAYILLYNFTPYDDVNCFTVRLMWVVGSGDTHSEAYYLSTFL